MTKDFIQEFIEKKDITVLILFLMNIIGLFYLASKQVEAGVFYLNLSFLFIAMAFFIMWMFPGLLEKAPIIAKNTTVGVQFFFLGAIIPLLLKFIGVITSKIMHPQFMFSQKIWQAFALEGSRWWNFYITTITASVQEELAFGAMFTIVGMIFGYFILRRMWDIDFGPKGNYVAYVLIGSVFSMVLFGLWHAFNPVYLNPDGSINLQMMIIAMLFRGIMNIIMFLWAGLSFTISFHLVNNLLTLSTSTIVGALTSIQGIIFMMFILSMVWFFVKNFKSADMSWFGVDVW